MAIVTVFGGSGVVGGALLGYLLDQGHSVTAMVRTPSKVSKAHSRLSVVQGDLKNAEQVKSACEGADVVLSAAGNIGKHHIMETAMRNILAAKPKRLIVLTTIGVGGSSRFANYLLKFIIISRKSVADYEAADAMLREQSEVPVVVVRPVGLSESPASGKWRTTLDTGSTLAKLPKADVAGFMATLVDDKQFDGKAVQLHAK